MRRASCASASVRSARVSKISAAGCAAAISVRTTGSAASVRSPEKPAPEPISKGAVMVGGDRIVLAGLGGRSHSRALGPSQKTDYLD
ncbi:exported hypothetical protein [Cupriavidus taiwanensis]|nr:exported hypothetical protein [Cupriavidus taiwanensis]SOZ29967.1 exported hypothetical protein [Cupriavidus taiwanensis]SOZ47022.1 exported hypothetical protein [Cupriavidus taiwanensis]